MDMLLLLAGALTGLLVGLVGVGGGALMTPILLLLFGVAPLSAVGTDLWFAAITKVFATRVHHGHGLIDWQIARRLWVGSLSAALCTLVWMKFYPFSAESSVFLKSAIAIAVCITAIGMLVQKWLHRVGRQCRIGFVSRFKSVQLPLTILAGVLLGCLVTLTSVGAGTLGAVFLTYLYPLRMTAGRLVATDIVHAIPLAVFSGLGHLLLGHVDAGLLLNMLVGSIPAVIVGAMVSARLPHQVLRNLLAAVLLVIAYQLWRSVRGGV